MCRCVIVVVQVVLLKSMFVVTILLYLGWQISTQLIVLESEILLHISEATKLGGHRVAQFVFPKVEMSGEQTELTWDRAWVCVCVGEGGEGRGGGGS